MPSEEEEDEVNRRTSESRIKQVCFMPSEEEEDEVNRRTSESRIKQACFMPSEEEEDEVNRRMRTEQIAEMINRQRLHIRNKGQHVTYYQVYAVVCHFPDMFVKAEGRIMLMI